MNAVCRIACFLVLAVLMRGQTTTGEIIGTITDPTGAAIPNVKLSLTRLGTGIEITATSDESGNYQFSRILPAEYRLDAEQPSFKKHTVNRIQLLTGQRARVDIAMQLGDVAQSVQVEAGVLLLETDNSDLGQVIDERRIRDLPLNGRTFFQLAALVAGTSPLGTGSVLIGRSELGLAIDGQKGDSNSFLLDGVETQSARFGTASLRPSVDAIQEFKLQRSVFTAEFGQNQAVVNTTIKAGTNQFHGTVFEFLRNNKLDARNFFDGFRRPPFRQNNYGFSFGGPLIRQKTFFFVNYESFRQRLALPRNGLYPTRAQMNGNLADDSAGTAIRTRVVDPLNGQPFPDNVIPAARISQTFRRMVQFVPIPNVTTPGNLGSTGFNTLQSMSNKNDWDQFHTRVDHNFSPRDHLFARFSWSDEFLINRAIPPLEGTAFPLSAKNIAVNHTHIFTTRTLSEFRFGYNRARNANIPEGAFGTDVLKEVLGFRNTPTKPIDFGQPLVSIQRFSNFGGGRVRLQEFDQLYHAVGSVSHHRGNHSLKAGVDYRKRVYFDVSNLFLAPHLQFQERYSGSALADAMLGYVGQLLTGGGEGYQNLRNFQTGLYVQDDWKVTSKLTVNLGLRWEFSSPPVEKENRRAAFRDGRILLAGRELPRGLFNAEYRRFSPRLGLAWQLGRKTVFRAGAGIFYSQTMWLEQQASIVNPPFFASATLVGDARQPDILLDQLLPRIDPANPGPNVAPRSFGLPYLTPYASQWNANIQHSVTADLLVEVGYAGSSGRRVGLRYDQNQAVLDRPGQTTPIAGRRPFPQFAEVQTYANIGKSNYQSMFVRAERRLRSGFTLLSTWTWAHARDTGINDTPKSDVRGNIPGFGWININWASSNLDQRHVSVSSVIYELPFGPGKRWANGTGWQGRLWGGWQINALTTFASGRPVDVTIAGDRANIGTALAGAQRPIRIGEGNCKECKDSIRSRPRLTEYFRTADFVLPPVGALGNNGRNVIRGPGLNNWDLALLKITRVHERLGLQFRAEFFNAFNQAQFNPPGGVINGAGFGTITSAREPRDIQLALKLIF